MFWGKVFYSIPKCKFINFTFNPVPPLSTCFEKRGAFFHFSTFYLSAFCLHSSTLYVFVCIQNQFIHTISWKLKPQSQEFLRKKGANNAMHSGGIQFIYFVDFFYLLYILSHLIPNICSLYSYKLCLALVGLYIQIQRL